MGRFTDQNQVRAVEGRGVIPLEDFSPAGVGPRLEDGDQSGLGISGPDGGQGLPDRGRMVGEIVDDRHPVHHAPDFLAATDALEGLEAGSDLVQAYPGPVQGRGRGQGVEDVMGPGQGADQPPGGPA